LQQIDSTADSTLPREHAPRLILYVGKGGVGKTTLAAAAAVRSAEMGHRTLVVSTDLAHSLGDVLDAPLDGQPRELVPGLFAQEINILEEIRRSWGKVQDQLAEFLRNEGMSDIQADEIAILPGMEEVAALVQIERQGRLGNYDCIVIDAAPTGETMRLLSLPESFQWYAVRIRDWRGRLGRMAGPLFNNLLPDLSAVDVMSRLAARVKALREALVDPVRSTYRIVLTPDRAVLREAQRAETYLNMFQYPVDSVFVNRILPPAEVDGTYLDLLIARQATIMDEIRAAFTSLPLCEVPLTAEEPIGMLRLSELAQIVYAERDPTEVMHTGPSLSIDRRGDRYVLSIPMPNVEIHKLDLTRHGDQLYVDVGNFRRAVALPLALADLSPGVASVQHGMLEIPFEQRALHTPAVE
jgi:arsenite-transporting ATPase